MYNYQLVPFENAPEIHLKDFDFYDIEAFNQCENNNAVMMAVGNLLSVMEEFIK